MLGPLVNPTLPRHQLLGVYNLKLMRLYNYIAQKEGINFTIVHSLDGYDEISLTSPFKVVGKEEERVYNPIDLGLPAATEADLWGGETIADAARIFDDVLAGEATPAQENCVVANAAFAIRTLEPEVSLETALGEARESICSGRAAGAFKKFVEINS